jgi:hypothetical protein
MVIFNSYVKLPEGNIAIEDYHRNSGLLNYYYDELTYDHYYDHYDKFHFPSGHLIHSELENGPVEIVDIYPFLK